MAKREHKCGVYVIEQVGANRCYVGSSADCVDRWLQHRKLLNSGLHHSAYLQNAWAKYGPDAFTFRVLEECHRTDLIALEQEYIDALKPAFNICPVAGSRAGSRTLDTTKIRVAGRNRSARTTHCPKGHEYSPENTMLTKRNQRVCLRCAADKQIAKYQHTTPFRADGPVCRKGHEWTPENTITLKSGTRQCRACKQQRIDARNARNRQRYESDPAFRERNHTYYDTHREEILAQEKIKRDQQRAAKPEPQPSTTCAKGHPWAIGATGRQFCPTCRSQWRAQQRASESPEARAARLARRRELERAGYHDGNQRAYAKRKALLTASH